MQSDRKRGKGKKLALAHIALRVPVYVKEHFYTHHAAPTQAMRAVLQQYVDNQTNEENAK